MEEFLMGRPGLLQVEIQVDWGLSNPWLYGSFVLRALGHCLRTDDYHDLEDIQAHLARVAHDNGKRDNLKMFALPAEDVVRWIRAEMYEEDQDFNESFTGLPKDVHRFCINFHPALGTDWVFLITHGDDGRLIWSNNSGEVFEEAISSRESLESAIDGAAAFLVGCIQRLHHA